ncbi:MAG: alpha/beta fold hydrolase [Bryobacteraceae bacterium]
MPETLILTHGAGSDRNAPLLVAVDGAISAPGVRVLRVNLPFRDERPTGPPRPGDAARDRAGLRDLVLKTRAEHGGRVFLGGHSYGGRQASMLASDEPGLVDGLVLLSYPLHPPRRPSELRTAHFASLRTPVLFVHGSRDPFGLPAELEAAVKLIPGPVTLVLVERAGHDLKAMGIGERIAAAFAGVML